MFLNYKKTLEREKYNGLLKFLLKKLTENKKKRFFYNFLSLY